MVAIAMMGRGIRAQTDDTAGDLLRVQGNATRSGAPRPVQRAAWDRPVVDRSGYYHGANARTPGYQNDKLIAAERYVIERKGKTHTSPNRADPFSGIPNPEADGPPAPAWQMLNRRLSWQVGTDGSRNLDNDLFHASTVTGDGRRFPLSNQGSTTYEHKFGGTPGLYHPYGVRGHVMGPAPRVMAQPGGPYMPGTVLAQGAPQDGPQLVSGGYPHGRHTKTVPPALVTNGRRHAVTQMKSGRQSRPANSKIAGQSYSQTVVHQDGSGGQVTPTLFGGRPPGMNGRWRATT